MDRRPAQFSRICTVLGGHYSSKVFIPHRRKLVHHVEERALPLRKFIIKLVLILLVMCRSILLLSVDLQMLVNLFGSACHGFL